MRSYRKELWLEIPSRRGMVNITPQVEECLRESGVREGLCLVNAMHITTASVFINDDEAGLHQDYERWLEELAPHQPVSRYRHNRTGEACAEPVAATTGTPTSSARLWAGRWWRPSPEADWISGPGSRYSTGSSTEEGEKAC